MRGVELQRKGWQSYPELGWTVRKTKRENKMRLKLGFARIVGLALATSAPALYAADNPAGPTFGADGTVHVPAFDLPASELSSPEARAATLK